MSNRLNEISQNLNRVMSLNEERIHIRNIEKYNKNKKYRESNPEKFKYSGRSKERDRFYKEVRRAKEKKLESSVSQKEWAEYLEKNFNSRCPITNNEDFHIDHFIPLSWGHGGTYIGNIIPLCSKLNISKGNKNPFEWRALLETEQKKKFDSVVRHLSEVNEMSCDLFKEFVYWCEKNKRNVAEIKYGESSIMLFHNSKATSNNKQTSVKNPSKDLNNVNNYINLLKKLLDMNKGIPVSKETVIQCCNINKVKFFSFYNKDIRDFFSKENIEYNPRYLLNK